MHADLATFQRDFAAAILSGGESEFDRWPGFAVYRNNSAMAAIEALAGAYPTVRKILGEFGFRMLALDFFRSNPPTNPVLASYDDRFAAHGDLRTRSARFPCLTDIARIDRMQIESHLAHDPPDAAGLTVSQIADVEWAQAKAVLHSATRFRWFATPAPIAWLALRQNAIEDVASPPRGASGILLTRPFGAVEAMVIDRVEFLLLHGLAQGRSVADAALRAAKAHPEENVGAPFKRLLDSGAIHYFEKMELN
ncbi:DNA-binding domain-containing protein [Methylocystis sp. SC2]|uniref:HvfC/BufC N-terminal domain-containing protein n=1 Tax=Methylocystis sp. (strain SC2) TaxID=187303 RepID=UPI00027AEE63|nr:DNA-binding domain-containing protein [Methylocystis sp. SC2]CCJ07586.1 Conserved hypothetical protein [Methylocystis sp. SC2]